ncbi:MAG: hypothetical protein ACYDAZ_08450 [Thermoplasmataceae archaeon]
MNAELARKIRVETEYYRNLVSRMSGEIESLRDIVNHNIERHRVILEDYEESNLLIDMIRALVG